MFTENEQNDQEDSHPGKDLKTYVESRIQLFLINLAEEVSYLFADSIQRVVGILLIGGGILFAWLAFAFFLGEQLGSTSLGFLIASVPPLVAGYLFNKRESKALIKKLQTGMISKMLENFDSTAAKENGNQDTNQTKEGEL